MKELSNTDSTTIEVEEPKGIKSFLKYAIEREGKKYDDNSANQYVRSHNSDNTKIIQDVAERFGIPENEYDAFRERAYQEFGINDNQTDKTEVSAVNIPQFNKGINISGTSLNTNNQVKIPGAKTPETLQAEQKFRQNPRSVMGMPLNQAKEVTTNVTEQNQKQNKYLKRLGKTAWNELNVGGNQLGSWIADVPGLIYDLAGAPFRAVGLNVPKSEDFKGGALDRISDYYKANAQAFETRVEEINPGREQGVINAFKKGDIGQGVLNLTGSVSESLPASIAMIMSGGATMPTILGSAAVFGAGKVQELDDNAPELDYDKRRLIGVLNGTLEGVFETWLGSGAIGRSLTDIIKQEGKKEAKQQIKKSLSTVFSDMLTKNPWLAPLGEGFEEVGTQITQNMVDKYSGYRPDINVMDGVGDAFAAGLTMGAVHSSMLSLAKEATKPEQQKQVEKFVTEYGSKDGTVTSAEIEGQTYYIKNPEDLGKEGKFIFAKDENGKVKPFPSIKVQNPKIQSPEEIKAKFPQEDVPVQEDFQPNNIPVEEIPINQDSPVDIPKEHGEAIPPGSDNEIDIDLLSPKERFETLINDDEEIAREILKDDINTLRLEAEELQKQNPEKFSGKYAKLKRLKQIEREINELEGFQSLSPEDIQSRLKDLTLAGKKEGTAESQDSPVLGAESGGTREDYTGSFEYNPGRPATENTSNELNPEFKEQSGPASTLNQISHPETSSLIGQINNTDSRLSQRFKELKEDEIQALVFEKDEIKKQISAFKEGVRLGRSDIKEKLKDIQTAIVNYAKKNMPLDEAGQRDLGTLLTSIKNAQTPAAIDKAFNKIDELTGKVIGQVERNKNARNIQRTLKWMTTYRKKGTNKHGKFTYPDVKEFTELKQIDDQVQRLASVYNSRNASDIEKQEANTRLNEIQESIETKENKNLLDETILKLIELRRNGAKASNDLVKTIAEDLQTIYQAAKEAKSDEDIQKALERSEDKEFIKQFVRDTKIDDKNYLSQLSTRLGNFTTNTMGNWETLLTVLGGLKARDKFTLIIDQVNQEIGIQDSFDEVLDETYKTYGFKTKNNLLQRIQDMKKEDYRLVQPIIKGRRIEGSPLKISKMQIIDIYNAVKQDEIRNDYYLAYGDIVKHGDGTIDREAQRRIGKQRIDSLINKLTPADRAFGDIMQQKVNDYYEKVNPVFIKLFNRDMPKNKNYWMSTVERSADYNIFENYMIDTKHPGFSKGRTNHRTPKPGDAFDKFSKHVQQAEWYANMGLPVDQLERIFRDVEVRNLIIENRGDKFYQSITKHIKNQGLQKSTRDLTDFERIGGNILGNWVAAKIGLTPSVPFKQLMSVINYSENMPMDQWVTGFAKGLATPKETFDEMWNNIPYLRTRFKKGYSEALEYAMNATSDMPKARNFHQSLKNFETIGTRAGDIAAIIYGGKPYVDYLINVKGLSKEKAYEQFLLDTLRSQQSPFSSTLSIYQNSKNPFARALFTFANTPSQYMRKMFEANAAYRHGDITRGQLAKTYFIYAVANQALYVGAGVLIRALLGKGWPEPEEFAKETGAQIVTSFVGGIPLARDVANAFSREMLGLRVYSDNLPVLGEMERATLSFAKLVKGKGDIQKYLKNIFVCVLELGGVGANNALRLWDATVDREKITDDRKIDEEKRRMREVDAKLNTMLKPKSEIEADFQGMSPFYINNEKNQPDYLIAEAADNLKKAYSTAKSKSTKIEKEGEIANAELLRDAVEQSKIVLSHSKYTYEDILDELDYIVGMIKSIEGDSR